MLYAENETPLVPLPKDLKENKLIIFSGPSGAGKTTIVQYLLDEYPCLQFSISATTRKPRTGEIPEKDYHFLCEKDFLQRVARKEFVEFETVYSGTRYGTLCSEIERIEKLGKHVVFDVDVVGASQLKKKYGDRALSIFVKPPSMEVLAKRLADRDTDTPAELAIRIEKAHKEMTDSPEFDVVLPNDDLEEACKQASNLVKDFISGNTTSPVLHSIQSGL